MNQLLSRILDAHGSMDRWRDYEKVEATIVAGGGFFPLKGMIQDATPRRLTAWLHQERSSVLPFGAPDQRAMSTAERIAIETLDGVYRCHRGRKLSRCRLADQTVLWLLPMGIFDKAAGLIKTGVFRTHSILLRSWSSTA